ncbi:hypothetical protein GGF31_000886 [Allomyces arbusculus]|nr:hypothetical protein GGF31_000886 [Allomyces arbusculus]
MSDPAPAAPVQPTRPAAPAQASVQTTAALAAPAPAAATRAAATPKNIDTETNTTCCFFIEIRVGVLVILFLHLIYYLIETMLDLVVTAVLGAIGLIPLLIMVLRFALTCWGIYAASKRIGVQFKAFAAINMVLWMIGLLFDILSFNVWKLLIDVLLAYFAYVFWVYAGILERGNKAARGNVEAPTFAPVAPVARVVETNTTAMTTTTTPAVVADATPVIAPAAEPVVGAQPVASAAGAGNQ